MVKNIGMADLPRKILQDVFKNLEQRSDIAKCQLTCHSRYQAAKERLYESVRISSVPKARSFIRTIISTTTNAGRLVKIVDVQALFEDCDVWDPFDIFTHIAECCPNLVKIITAPNVSTVMYGRLLYSRYNNQLQHLQYIPYPPRDTDIESYAHTALAFRNTLKKVLLCNQLSPTEYRDSFNSSDLYSKTYNMLLSKLKEFIVLKRLKVIQHVSNNSSIIYHDSLIKNCPTTLESLQLNIFMHEKYPKKNNRKEENMALHFNNTPYSGIKAFRGNREIIKDDNSLKYLMRQFPNLDRLCLYTFSEMRYDFYIRSYAFIFNTKQLFNFSEKTMIDFFKYLANIPSVDVEFVYKENMIEAWTKFMEEENTNKFKRIITSIDYYTDVFNLERENEKPNIRFSRNHQHADDLIITMLFPVKKRNYEINFDTNKVIRLLLPHMNLIEKIGCRIQRLQVNNVNKLQRYISKTDGKMRYYCRVVNGYWLEHTLQNCASLKSLHLNNPGRIEFSKEEEEEEEEEGSKEWRNTSLERLKISHLQGKMSGTLFRDLSMHLPSLKYLHLNCSLKRSSRKKNITIDMINTSFDTFVWDDTVTSILDNLHWKFYMKIITTIGTSGDSYFFVGNKSSIRVSSAEDFKLSLKNSDEMSFDIRCKEIKNFKIKLKDFEKSYILVLNNNQ